MIDLGDVLYYLRPNASWSIVGNTYEGIVWEGPGEKPTQREVNAALPEAEVYWKRKQAALPRAKFKIALLDIGELQAVKDYVLSTSDERLKILWEDSAVFERLDPDLVRLSAELGYSDAKLDALFGIK